MEKGRVLEMLLWKNSNSVQRMIRQLMPVRDRRTRRPNRLTIEVLEARCLLAASTFTPEEQLLLELVNRSRADPVAEAARQGIALNQGLPPETISAAPKPPLAGNNLLGTVADGHTGDMMTRGFFAHDSPAPGSTTPSDRINQSGYPWTNSGENLAIQPYAAFAPGVVTNQMHGVLFKSLLGHRQALLNDVYFETGIEIEFGAFNDTNNIFGSGVGVVHNVGLATEVFGTQPGSPAFLVGIVFTDANDGSAADDNFFTIGEQAGDGGTVTATNIDTGQSYAETIGSAGGYSISVPTGTYNVITSGGGLAAQYAVSGVVVGGTNVKVDFETTTATAAAPAVNLSADANVGSEADQTLITLTATASAAVSGSQTVEVAVTGAGITDDDYELSTTVITIPNGKTRGTATFTVIDDGVVEALETATVTVTGQSAGLIPGASLSTDIAISSNDVAAFTRGANAIQVSESGTSDTFTVVLAAEPQSNVTFGIHNGNPGEASATPGTYTLQEVAQGGWQQTAPGSQLPAVAYDLDTQLEFRETPNTFENWGG
jgi:hypothetical protein